MQSRHAPSFEPSAHSPCDLDVGIIYSGERHFMTPLLSSLADSHAGLSMRLLLVDNASPDGVAQWSHLCPPMQPIVNARPLGYAPNLNRILEASDARYALLLNTDMYFDPAEQCLAKMVAFMDAHPRCGLSICRLYHADGTYGHPARRFPSLAMIAARRLGMQRLFSRSADGYLYQENDRLDSFECDWVSGCFMLVRREAVREVGKLDEGFKKYFEDVDFSLRFARAGWQVMFHGGTYCYHYEQRASRRLLSRDAWLHGRSYLRWLRKWGLAPQRRTATAPAILPGSRPALPGWRHDMAHVPLPAAKAGHASRSGGAGEATSPTGKGTAGT